MTSNFIRYDQDQQHLLPKDVSEWVEEDSLERFVSDTIDYLDEDDRLDPFHPEETGENRGRPQFHPVMLLKVLVFAYTQGIRSSRKIGRFLERDVAFRYLAANQQPDFRTISTFRKDHREDFQHLFVEIVRLCSHAGMVQMGEIALDGRRVQGDAALDQNRARDQLEAKMHDIPDEAAGSDDEADKEYGPESRGDELPEELQDKERRLERLREAKAKLDQQEQELKDNQRETIRQREQEEAESGELKRGPKPTPPEDIELDEDTKANTTDPESQTMKSYDGWKQGYNGQAMVDCNSQVIVAQDVTTDATDTQQLEPMLDECATVNGDGPSKVSADAGYWSTANANLADEETELFIATTKDWKRRKELREQGPPRGPIPDSAGPKQRMERKLRTKRARDIYGKRGQSVEPVFGQHVNRGLDRFMLRGEDGAPAEWSLFSATHNLMKLWRTRWASAG